MKTYRTNLQRTGTMVMGLVVLLASWLGTGNLRAEGSKELCANGGDRPWLMYRTDLTDNSPITNVTICKRRLKSATGGGPIVQHP
ncbi:MAG: hypothetical protein WCS70_04720, partial [Verrucomicrobiota bacterium]